MKVRRSPTKGFAHLFYEFRRRAVDGSAEFARTFPTDQAGGKLRGLVRVLGFGFRVQG